MGASFDVAVTPAQADLIGDTSSHILCNPGGVGSGKTEGLAFKAFSWASDSPGVPILLTEPTYPMIRDVLVPTMHKVLGEHLKCPYRYAKSDRNFYVRVGGKETEIRCRSADNFYRLMGHNVGCAAADEAGQQTKEALDELPRRCRHPDAAYHQILYGGTPEGFNRFWELCEGDPPPGSRLVRARTTDNAFLKKDYLRRLLEFMSPAEVDRYIRALFIPQGGTVYSHFERERHVRPCSNPMDGDHFMLADFNVDPMHWACAVLRGTDDAPELHVFDELRASHTTTLTHAQEAVTFWLRLGVSPSDVTVICDASGSARRTSALAGTDVAILRGAGFVVSHPAANPPIVDRVNTVNSWLSRDWLYIDPKARLSADSLERQGYLNGAPSKRDGYDHAVDGIGYGCFFLKPLTAPMGNATRYG